MKFLHNVSSFEERKQLDQQKSQLCKEKGTKMLVFVIFNVPIGITLVEVPYWWDRKFESLQATIFSQRPDLFKNPPVKTPIPVTKPTATPKLIYGIYSFYNHNSYLKDDIKKYFMLAKNWDNSSDPTGWLMSEKYDGMRLYWNGSDFFTRQGKKVKVPYYWKRQMPRYALDGELW